MHICTVTPIKTWLSTCQHSWKGLATRSSSHAMLFSTFSLNDSGWGREWKSCVISRSLTADEQQLENCNQTEWIGMGRSGTLNLAKRQLWNWICLLVVSMCLLLRPGKSFFLFCFFARINRSICMHASRSERCWENFTLSFGGKLFN